MTDWADRRAKKILPDIPWHGMNCERTTENVGWMRSNVDGIKRPLSCTKSWSEPRSRVHKRIAQALRAAARVGGRAALEQDKGADG